MNRGQWKRYVHWRPGQSDLEILEKRLIEKRKIDHDKAIWNYWTEVWIQRLTKSDQLSTTSSNIKMCFLLYHTWYKITERNIQRDLRCLQVLSQGRENFVWFVNNKRQVSSLAKNPESFVLNFLTSSIFTEKAFYCFYTTRVVVFAGYFKG